MSSNPDRYDFLPTASLFSSTTNPRTDITPASVADLAASLKAHGMIEPIIVRDRGKDGMEIAAGARRFAAAQAAGLENVPVIVKEMTDEELALVQLVENVQRKDLAPLELAAAYKRLIDDFGYTPETISGIMHVGKRTVYQTLQLLKLTPEAAARMERGEINATTGALLVRLPKADQVRALEAIPAGLPVAAAEVLISSYDPKAAEKAPKKAATAIRAAKKKMKAAKRRLVPGAMRAGIATAQREQAILERALVKVVQQVHDQISTKPDFRAWRVPPLILRQFDIDIPAAVVEIRGLQKIASDDAKEAKWIAKIPDEDLFAVWLESLVGQEYAGFKEEPLNDLLEFCGLPKYAVMLKAAKKAAAAELSDV